MFHVEHWPDQLHRLPLGQTEKLQTDERDGTLSVAVFSQCGAYRYFLHRHWGAPDGRVINFLMLNPSTADAFRNDPTVARCENRSREWRYAGFSVTNLFAYRSTSPVHLMRRVVEPIGGDRNLYWILWAAQRAETVVVAWGNHGKLRRDSIIRWDLEVLDKLVEAGVNPRCFGQNAGGTPKHPLYLSRDLQLRPFLDSVL